MWTTVQDSLAHVKSETANNRQGMLNVYPIGATTLILLRELRSAAKLSKPHSVNPIDRNVPPWHQE